MKLIYAAMGVLTLANISLVASYRIDPRELTPLQKITMDYVVAPAAAKVKQLCQSAADMVAEDPQGAFNTVSMTVTAALALRGVIHVLQQYPLSKDDALDMSHEAFTHS